jgi:hypothetical protein
MRQYNILKHLDIQFIMWTYDFFTFSEMLHNVKSRICSIVNKKDKVRYIFQHIGGKNGKHDNHILELKKHNCIM